MKADTNGKKDDQPSHVGPVRGVRRLRDSQVRGVRRRRLREVLPAVLGQGVLLRQLREVRLQGRGFIPWCPSTSPTSHHHPAHNDTIHHHMTRLIDLVVFFF